MEKVRLLQRPPTVLEDMWALPEVDHTWRENVRQLMRHAPMYRRHAGKNDPVSLLGWPRSNGGPSRRGEKYIASRYLVLDIQPLRLYDMIEVRCYRYSDATDFYCGSRGALTAPRNIATFQLCLTEPNIERFLESLEEFHCDVMREWQPYVPDHAGVLARELIDDMAGRPLDFMRYEETGPDVSTLVVCNPVHALIYRVYPQARLHPSDPEDIVTARGFNMPQWKLLAEVLCGRLEKMDKCVAIMAHHLLADFSWTLAGKGDSNLGHVVDAYRHIFGSRSEREQQAACRLPVIQSCLADHLLSILEADILGWQLFGQTHPHF